MIFHPTGPSTKVNLSSMLPQTVEITSMSGENNCLRVVAISYPRASTLLVALGADNVDVNNGNGMPIDLSGSKEYFIGVRDETHLAMMMTASNAFDIMVTPGEMI